MRIIKIVDPEHYKIVLKERILDFFAISGFKIIAQLDNEQKRLHRALEKAKERDGNVTLAQIDVITTRDIDMDASDSDYSSEDESNGTSRFGKNTYEQTMSISRSVDHSARNRQIEEEKDD